MAFYQYKARNNQGQLQTGTLEAESASQVAQNLTSRGLIPVFIEQKSQATDILQQFEDWQALHSLNITDLILFSRQMYSLTKAGVPIIRAINSLVESTRNPALAKALRLITRNLESGQSLSQAMSRHEKIFPVLIVSIINVGESTGGLEQAFFQIARYLEREKETQNRIKSALRYPTMVIIAISVAMAIINIYVIPAFKGAFDKLGAELPWQTRLLMAISDFSVQYWPHILGGLAVSAFITIKYINTPTGKLKWHWFLLKIPAVGSIIERATMERFARSFAMILSAGVPLIHGISIVAKAIGNQYIGSKLERMRIGIEKGDSISRMAQSIGLFPPLVIQMIIVGEETGNISDMLEEVADFYEAEIDAELKNLAGAIEPFMIVIIGIMVLIMALGIFLPMWNLSSATH